MPSLWSRFALFVCVTALAASGCDDGGEPVPIVDAAMADAEHDSGPQVQVGRCPAPVHVREPRPLGTFKVRGIVSSVDRGDRVSITGGAVYDRIPERPWLGHALVEDGPCTLFRPQPTCAEGCADVNLCPAQDECIDARRISVGEVVITGLEQSPIVVAPRPDLQNYIFSVDYPGSRLGAEVTLRAEGGDIEGFELRAVGVGELSVPEQTITVEEGSAVALHWEPGNVDLPLCMHIVLRISELTWIECSVDDDGSYEISEPMISRMFEFAPSLTNYVTMSRSSRGTAELEAGEVRLDLSSFVELPIEIPSLIDCRDRVCPEGMGCGSNWVCRPIEN